MKNYLLIILFFSVGLHSFCQGKKNLPNTDNKFAFEVSGFGSKIVKHTKKIIPDVTEPTYGFEVSASYKTFGNKNWQRALNYPEIGISYVQTHFGNADIFGSAYGLMPYAKFNIARRKIVSFHAKLGGGLAYLNKPYDIKTNPTNNVIGSKLNTLVQFRLGLDFHLTREVDLQLAGTFMHYSNASTQSPNLGINVPSANIGIIYKPKQFETEYIKEQDKTIVQKKNEYAFKFSLGMREKNPRGAKFPTYSFALQYGRYFGYANKLLAGALVSFDQYEYDFMLIQELDVHKDRIFQSMDWSVYLGYELMLGNVGLGFIVGAYVYDPGFAGAPIWAKPGITYYFPGFGKGKHTPFLGVNMKTHYFTAQYVEMNFGIAF